ncbi:OLC1v1024954C1 [Oldenlandia corymbosa var. corymbosa]|uniref:OLC1v1024954C1 n=1 Tax=Oldenlandia corymbosa var. corymbosa TaxID=529605 RepID=A0AAV1C3W7_OLDCO|nr:OLC1v1024954C1 [Oldenlandia corymbosa var. corymbosa]
MAVASRPPDETRSPPPSFAQVLNGTKPSPRSLIYQAAQEKKEASFITSKPSLYKGESPFLLSKEEDACRRRPPFSSLSSKNFLKDGRRWTSYGKASICRHGKGKVQPKIDNVVVDGNKDSSSGLTSAEKEKISIDLTEKSTPIKPVASANRKISKQQLSSIIEKNGTEESSWDDEAAGKNSNLAENLDKQLTVYDPKLNISSRFDVLAETADDHVITKGKASAETFIQVENPDDVTDSEDDEIRIDIGAEQPVTDNSVRDDIDIGRHSEGSRHMVIRAVESDDEGKQKRPGRPKGSIKSKNSQTAGTRKSLRLNCDCSTTVSNE